MTLLFLLSYTSLLYLPIYSQTVDLEDQILSCENDPCVLIPQPIHKYLVCQNQQENCILYCISPQQCNNLILYSGSPNTIIYCTQIDSCKNATFNIGPQNISKPILYELEINNDVFSGEKSKLILNCDGKNGCEDINLNINGYYSENIEINGLNYESLFKSKINANIFEEQTITINCGTMDHQSCQNIDINCISGKCICIGQSCPNNAMQPTFPPSPTPQPTILPECQNVLPTKNTKINVLTCHENTQGPCILIPEETHDIVVCTNKYDTCIIDCKDKRQCWHGLTIFSGSRNTILYCSNEESCKNANFYVGELDNSNNMPKGFNKCDFYGAKNSLKLDCNSESSCENSDINIVGEFMEIIQIDALGEETLFNTKLTVNVYHGFNDIYLNCGNMISMACYGLHYKCLSGHCKCEGETCPKIITVAPTHSPSMITSTPTSISPTKTTQTPTGTRIPTMVTLIPSSAPTPVPTGQTIDVYPNGDQLVICTNEVDYCIINCVHSQSCKISQTGLIVYSAAKYTIIKCTNEDSCTEAKFILGIPKKIPKSYLLKDFEGTMNELIIDCTGKAACQGVTIEVYGEITNGVIINANNYDSFEEGSLECYLQNHEKPCILNCALERNWESCELTTVDCLGNCICNGESCQGAILNMLPVTTTLAPTMITVSPTQKPTMPTPLPTSPPVGGGDPFIDNNNQNNFIDPNNRANVKSFLGIYHYALLAGTIVMLLLLTVCCCMRISQKRTQKKQAQNGLLEQMSNKSNVSTTLQYGEYTDYGTYNSKNETAEIALYGNEIDELRSTEL